MRFALPIWKDTKNYFFSDKRLYKKNCLDLAPCKNRWRRHCRCSWDPRRTLRARKSMMWALPAVGSHVSRRPPPWAFLHRPTPFSPPIGGCPGGLGWDGSRGEWGERSCRLTCGVYVGLNRTSTKSVCNTTMSTKPESNTTLGPKVIRFYNIRGLSTV